MKIEKITTELISNEKDLFSQKKHKNKTYLEATHTGRQLHLATLIDTREISQKLRSHTLSPFFGIFSEACIETGIESKTRYNNSTKPWSQEEASELEKLAEKIKEKAKTEEFKTKLNNHRRASNKNTKETQKYIRKLFIHHARLLAIRIDLSYNRTINFRNDNSKALEQVKSNRKELLKYLRKKYNHELIGYIWKLEYGIERGYHYHVMIFLDGSRRQQDVTIAKVIGEHWSHNITSGDGIYYNCNADKGKYGESLGIGIVNHTDHRKISNLVTAATYLTKVDYYASLKNERGRNFGKGKMPPDRTSMVGRPRQAN